MDVSNSTGEGTGYRVVGSGGAAPSTWKLRSGQEVVEVKGKKYVRINTLWHEVLAEGTLEPYTYVTVKSRKKIHAVEFFRGKTPLCSRDVTTVGAQSKAETAPASELLVALMPNGNGKSTAETCVCRWKKA